jgi:hypothetical protein
LLQPKQKGGCLAEYVEDEDYVQDPSLVLPSRPWQYLLSELNSYNISESQPDRVTLGFGKEWHLFALNPYIDS